MGIARVYRSMSDMCEIAFSLPPGRKPESGTVMYLYGYDIFSGVAENENFSKRTMRLSHKNLHSYINDIGYYARIVGQ